MTEKDRSGPGLFSGSRLAALMEKMTEMPETRLADVTASKTFGRGALGEIVSDRISGKPIPEISMEHFGGAGAEQIPACVQAIYGKISRCGGACRPCARPAAPRGAPTCRPWCTMAWTPTRPC